MTTVEQNKLVQTSFNTYIWPVSNQAAQFFYQEVFRLDPQLRVLFKTDEEEQWRKLMELLWVGR